MRPFTDWKTTLIGFVIACLVYLAGPGFKLPGSNSPAEWVHAIAAVLLAGVSAVMKDQWIGLGGSGSSSPAAKMVIILVLAPIALLGGCTSGSVDTQRVADDVGCAVELLSTPGAAPAVDALRATQSLQTVLGVLSAVKTSDLPLTALQGVQWDPRLRRAGRECTRGTDRGEEGREEVGPRYVPGIGDARVVSGSITRPGLHFTIGR